MAFGYSIRDPGNALNEQLAMSTTSFADAQNSYKNNGVQTVKGSYSIAGERAGHKPGSVLLRGQLSIWDVCYQTPQAALIERNW